LIPPEDIAFGAVSMKQPWHSRQAPDDSLQASELPRPDQPERRSFLRWAIHGMGVIFAAILGIPAILYLIDPRNRPAPPGDFRTTGVTYKELKKAGMPVQAVLRATRQDAWTLYPDDVIGRVWLIARSDGTVQAYSTICPHLGCSINFEEKLHVFMCPCHNATYDMHSVRMSGPAPRDMDELETKPAKPKPDDEILVKYEIFKTNENEKILKG
jgi:Rieske Fe-S protein